MELLYPLTALFGFGLGLLVCWLEYRWFKTIEKHWSWVRTLVVSVLMAITVPLLFYQYGFNMMSFGYTGLACILCAASLTDIDASVIPNKIIIGGMVVWAVTVWFVTVPKTSFGIGSVFASSLGRGFIPVMFDSLLGACVIAGFALLVSVILDQITGQSSLGGGDIKLLFMVGLFLGLIGSIFNLFLSCVLGLIIAAIWRRMKKGKPVVQPTQAAIGEGKEEDLSEQVTASACTGVAIKKKKPTFPFGPAIAIATIVTLIVGYSFLTWYIGPM